eukprot:1149323-Pelagomonas_calceolata.AAC.8
MQCNVMLACLLVAFAHATTAITSGQQSYASKSGWNAWNAQDGMYARNARMGACTGGCSFVGRALHVLMQLRVRHMDVI